MSTTETGRYQMLWDCPACGTAGLLGLDHRYCPSCGSPQDPTRRYFPTEAQKVRVEDHPYHGADRACPACETPNAAIAAHCVSCGSPMDAAKAVGLRAERAAGAEDSAQAARAEHEARQAAAREQARAQAAPRPSGRGWLFLAVGGGLLVVALACALFAGERFGARTATVTVTGHAWERTIVVEALKPVSESAWRDQVPAGARGVSCSRAQRDTRRIPDGQDCVTKRVDRGDGTFSEVQDCTTRYREEPVWDERCTYVVDRWVVDRTLKAEGAAQSPAPAWPSAPAATSTSRPGARAETYTVTLALPEGETARCELPEARWAAMAVGSRWTGTLGGLTGRLDCDSLAPE